jgi:hypothetical protein
MGTFAFHIDTNAPELAEKLQGKAAMLKAAVDGKIEQLSALMYQSVEEKLHGPVLHAITGALADSVVDNGLQYISGMPDASVEIPEDSPEHLIGAVHEYGGVGPYDIYPVNAQALAFIMGGHMVFSKHVVHPPALQRSFMISTLDEITPVAQDELTSTVQEVAEQ